LLHPFGFLIAFDRLFCSGRTSIKSMRVSGGDDEEDKQSEAQAALQRAIDNKTRVDGLDSAYGFDSHDSGERVGWLFNVCSVCGQPKMRQLLY
jgi:hypothetical protein